MSGPASPRIITVPFGSLALPGNINVIPVSPGAPQAACYQVGFPAQSMIAESAGGTAPQGQDFNGVLLDITGNLAYLQAGQGWPFNSTIASAIGGYNEGAIVANAALNGYWISQANGNTYNPDTTSPSSSNYNWLPAFGVGQSNIALTNANVTLTATQAANVQISFSGTLTGNVIIYFPDWNWEWYVYNSTAPGPYTITAIVAGGTGVVLPLGGINIICNGTDIFYATTSTGQFTGQYLGGTTEPSATGYYSRSGTGVILTLPVVSAPTSNATSLSMIGLPASLVPGGATQNPPVALAMNNSAYVAGAYAQPYSNSGVPTIAFGLLGSLTGWTNSGTKAVSGVITYDLLAGG
jgi:hypothetical protein